MCLKWKRDISLIFVPWETTLSPTKLSFFPSICIKWDVMMEINFQSHKQPNNQTNGCGKILPMGLQNWILTDSHELRMIRTDKISFNLTFIIEEFYIDQIKFLSIQCRMLCLADAHLLSGKIVNRQSRLALLQVCAFILE